MADDYSADNTADLLGLQSLKSDTDLSGWDSKSGDGGLLDAFEKSTANAADTIRKQMRKLSFDGGLRPKLGAEDKVATTTKSNVPSLSEAKKEAAATTTHHQRQATAQAKMSPWQVKRKSSRGTRKQEKMYQGRTTSQPKNDNDNKIERKNNTNNNTTPQLERKNSAPQEFRSSKYDASPPWTVKPKVQVGGNNTNKSRKEMFDAASVWAQQQKEHAERHRETEMRYSSWEEGRSRRDKNQRQFQRRRSRSLGSASRKSLDDIGTPSLPLSGGGSGGIAERRRSLSLDASDTNLGQRPSLKKRPVLTRRLSNQNELSSRSLLAGSIQQDQGRRNSFTTIHAPLKDNEKDGKTPSDRGRSRKGERPGPRRRSRSLGSASSGELLHELFPVAKLHLSEHTRPRRRSLSWDSGSEHGGTTTDFKAIREDLEKRRASSSKTELEEKEDLAKKKPRKHDADERKRQSMPIVRQTKKVDDSRKRHSMPANKARKGKSEEDSRKIEAFSDALKSGEASGRRTSRRAKASERVARLQSSLTNSMRKKRKSSSARTASGATAAAATVASGETSEEADQLLERHASIGSSNGRRSGFHISVFMMAVMCFCYLISLVGMCALGFFLHMEFFAYKDTDTTMKSNVDANQGMGTSSGTGPMLRPSLRPSGPTSGVNAQPIPTDGGLSTKLTPVTAAPSISPTERPSINPSSIPTPISSDIPSFTPTSSSSPSAIPSMSSMPSESPSLEPTLVPSTSPSASPTTLDECPETLTKSMPFISDTSLTLYYETVIYPSHPTGGLFCASLEYVGTAGWIGIAFSTAGRNPQFGRREAIIGIPGVDSSDAVSSANTTSQALNPSGSQSNFVDGGPYFVNPGKYVIPAGGLEGYYGPSLDLLMPGFQQTLVNASVTTSLNESNQTITRLSFAKYLREWGEITIDPLSGPTLILYAVAPVDENGTYTNDNPEWRYINLILETWSKRKRQHSDNTHTQ